jgi:hypothetical protein
VAPENISFAGTELRRAGAPRRLFAVRGSEILALELVSVHFLVAVDPSQR